MMAEADINEFLFGKPDHDIDDLYNFDDIWICTVFITYIMYRILSYIMY